MKGLKKVFCAVLAGAMAVTAAFVVQPPETVYAADSDEIMLGVFWTSDEDVTDTLYWSTDGENFYELCQPYVDATPNDASSMEIAGIPEGRHDATLHDPSIIYRDGYFWMLSGFNTGIGENRGFVPMMGYSEDLIHWSYPASGSGKVVKIPGDFSVSAQKGAEWDTVAPDFMVDEDGTVYIVVCAGYYALFHGDVSANDVMQPYLVKVTKLELRPEADPVNNPAAPPIAEYEDAVPINLPCVTERPSTAHNHIDGSLYKEDGWYYLSIKENGVTNEIYRISDLSKCGDASAWELVSYDVITGYEGPCLTKYQGQYFMYTDRLSTYVPVDSTEAFGSEGTWVVKASTGTTGKLDKYTGWLNANVRKIHTIALDGTERENRHGTVITLKGEAAEKVRALAAQKGYNDTTNHYSDANWKNTGWYYQTSYRTPKLGGKVVKYWYENDERQGISFNNPNYRGKEIYDPDSDGWYWLEAQYDGRLAVAENTYDEAGNMISSAYENGECEVAQPVDQKKYNEYGPEVYGTADSSWKWVRYDWQGKMVKSTDDSSARFYQDGKTKAWYRYDPVTGAMQKGLWGYINDDGYQVYCYFDPTTGIRATDQTIEVNGFSYPVDEYGTLMTWDEKCGPLSALPIIKYYLPGYQDPAASPDWEGWHEVNGVFYWYENGLRQGYDPDVSSYRGKEIFDPSTDAWYWLDNKLQGAKAVSKDVYQESYSAYPDREDGTGKWVRYDEDGHMVKGWQHTSEGTYYFEEVTGSMAKGKVTIDGETYDFDVNTGKLLD